MSGEAARGPERGRLFVALDLDDGTRAALATWQANVVSVLPGLRPVAEDALHATLCFLGPWPLDAVGAIAGACAAGSGGPLEGLALGRALWLPRRRPRLLAVAIDDPTGALARMQSALARALAAGGWYRPETRPYLAHVTIARAAKDQRLRGDATVPSPPAHALAGPASVTLYRSHLSPRGSRYEALAVVRTGAGSWAASAGSGA